MARTAGGSFQRQAAPGASLDEDQVRGRRADLVVCKRWTCLVCTRSGTNQMADVGLNDRT